MSIAIKAEQVSKKYNLGTIGTGTLFRDLNMYWAKLRGKANPYAKVGEESEFNQIEHWALRDVSFEIKQGEAIGIIGRNGAGKSTLLKILSRVTTPTSGQIKIRGRVASLLEVGTGFHPEMTGRENIFLNGAILGMTKAEIRSKFDEIVDFAGIQKYIDTPVKRYSSGMYVRLAFAVAAHLEPEILIVDEVLAVGDTEFQKKCLGKMEDVSKRQGRTVLFVSHNMAAIKSLCEKTLILDKGISIFNGSVSEGIEIYNQNNRVKELTKDTLIYDYRIPNKFFALDYVKVKPELSPILDKIEIEFKIEVLNFVLNKLFAFVAFTNADNEFQCISFSKDNAKYLEIIDNAIIGNFKFEHHPFMPGEYGIEIGLQQDFYDTIYWVKTNQKLRVEKSMPDGKNYDGREGLFTSIAEW